MSTTYDFEHIERELKRIAEIENHVERETEFEALVKATKASKKGLRQRLQQLMREMRLEDLTFTERVGIFFDPEAPRFEIGESIYNVLRNHPYYLYGGNLALLNQAAEYKEGLLTMILKAEDLQGPLLELCDFTEFNKYGELEHVVCPRGFVAAFLKSSFAKSFPRIRAITDITLLGEDFKPLKAGYDSVAEIYTMGQAIVPTGETKIIDQLLENFCFKSTSDRTNYLAAMLTALVHHHDALVAGVPALNLKANQPGLGKSVLAQILSVIRAGVVARTLSITNDETELEKRMCAALRAGGTILIFDNAKVSRNLQIISSAVIERTITDRIISYRILGTSTDFFMENILQVVFTHNGGTFSKDLISRQFPTQLHFEGDPAQRSFKIGDPVGFALEHRRQIVGELLGMFEKWTEAGRKMSSTKHRMQAWASLIGGVLEANGIEGFLKNFDEVAAQSDPHYESLQQLISTLSVGQKYRAKDLLNRAKTAHLFSAYFDGGRTGDAVSFGKLVGQYIGRKFKLSEKVVTWNGREEGGYGIYWTSVQAQSSGDEKATNSPEKSSKLPTV